MKTLYMIGGTMCVGKTSVCEQLKSKLDRCVFLDGDWCWNASPFVVNEETKEMVLRNICFNLNQFIHCSAYENIVFCWVMHEQWIIDRILSGLDTKDILVKTISLICSKETLKKNLEKDISLGIRTPEILERSIARLPLYEPLNTQKICTDDKSVSELADEIATLS